MVTEEIWIETLKLVRSCIKRGYKVNFRSMPVLAVSRDFSRLLVSHKTISHEDLTKFWGIENDNFEDCFTVEIPLRLLKQKQKAKNTKLRKKK